MNKLINVIILLLFCISNTSCAHRPRIVHKYIEKDVYCPSTPRPVFPKFEREKESDQITTPKNIETLLEIIKSLNEYAKKLEEEINCYKNQTNNEKVEDLEKDVVFIKKYIKKLTQIYK